MNRVTFFLAAAVTLPYSLLRGLQEGILGWKEVMEEEWELLKIKEKLIKKLDD